MVQRNQQLSQSLRSCVYVLQIYPPTQAQATLKIGSVCVSIILPFLFYNVRIE